MTSEANHAASRRWLDRWLIGNHPVVVPVLLLAEVAGAVARQLGDPAGGRQAVTDLRRLPRLRLSPMDDRLGMEAARLAADLRLRGADAVYVAVARRFSLPLVTWDREQLERARDVVLAYTPETAPTGPP